MKEKVSIMAIRGIIFIEYALLTHYTEWKKAPEFSSSNSPGM